MPTNQASIPYIKIKNIPAWLLSKIKRKNHSAGVILPTGESFYFVHGQQITTDEFNEIFPVEQPVPNVNPYGGKLDSRQID